MKHLNLANNNTTPFSLSEKIFSNEWKYICVYRRLIFGKFIFQNYLQGMDCQTPP